MSNLNSFNCSQLFGNTGSGNCDFLLKEIKGAIIVPNDVILTREDVAALQTYLEGKAKAALPSERFYFIHHLIGITDNSEEPVDETMGYGSLVRLRDGDYNWTFRFMRGGLCLLFSLQNFNGQPVSLLFYDSAFTIIGTKKGNGLGGVPVNSFYANKWTPADGSTAINLSFTVAIDSIYLNKRMAYIQTDESVDLASIKGLNDVTIETVSAAAGTATVRVIPVCGGSPEAFFDAYSADLVDEALWVANEKGSGDAETISAVAANSATKTFTLTFLPVRTADSIVKLVDTAALEVAGILNTESQPATVPMVYP